MENFKLKTKTFWEMIKWKANVITVNCRLKAPGFYTFVRDFKRAHILRDAYPRGF